MSNSEQATLSDAERQLRDQRDQFYAQLIFEDEHIKKLEEERNEPSLSTAKVVLTPLEEELQYRGFFDGKLDTTKQVDHKIHPIFRHENFSVDKGTETQVWNNMRPALTLATNLLTTPEFQRFWYHLLVGTPTTDEATGKIYLARSPEEDNLSTMREYFTKMLLDMADNIVFIIMPCKDRHKKEGILGSFTTSAAGFLESLGYPRNTLPPWLFNYQNRIGLSTECLYHLVSPNSPTRSDAGANTRFQFLLATTLCHELSHAMWQLRMISQSDPDIKLNFFEKSPLNRREPYVFLSDEMPEVGLSWENSVFGALPGGSIYHDIIGPVESTTWQNAYKFPSISAVVHMHWVEAWFREDTWERIDEAIQFNLLEIPKAIGHDGAKFYMAERYIPEDNEFSRALYRDGEAMHPNSNWVSEPPKDVPVEEWFAAVREEDVKLALESGYNGRPIENGWGFYEYLRR